MAIRFIRTLINMQEEFFIRHIVEKRVLGPILDVLCGTISRDNLLSSASLELFEYIKKENIKDLVKHLVETHRDRLVSLSYLSTFRDLVLRYDQTQGYTASSSSGGPGANIDYYLETDEESASVGSGSSGRKVAPGGANLRMMEHIAVDPAEEEYWNTSDPEDDDAPAAAATPASSNGASKPLVDYTSDDDDDNNTRPDQDSSPADEEAIDEEQSDDQPHTPTSSTGGPPKRRREDDEEDEMDKLSANKRRNSSVSADAAARARARNSRTSPSPSSPGATPPRKMTISLSSTALKTDAADE